MMWIQLTAIKHIEVLGKLTTYHPGDWVEVGKQLALKWIRSGDAASPKSPILNVASVAAAIQPQELVPRPVYTNSFFTLFSVPNAFNGVVGKRQYNAIGSWALLKPNPVIFLLGDETGIDEAARVCHCIYMPRIRKNQYGTPIVADAFEQIQRISLPQDVICYVNTDIILMQSWVDILLKVSKKFNQFLMISQRWDIDIDSVLVDKPDWRLNLCARVAREGSLHGKGAIDFFAFRSGLYKDIPPFAIGRSGWDNWLIGEAVRQGIPVVNVTDCTTVVHQNTPQRDGVIMTDRRQEERKRNRVLYNEAGLSGNVSSATWGVTSDGELTLHNTTHPVTR